MIQERYQDWPAHDDRAVFEFHAHDGREFKVYADGRTEGFGPGIVLNRYPLLLAKAKAAR